MGRLGILAAGLLVLAIWPDAVSAQCVSFSKARPCAASSGPLGRVDFRAALPQPKTVQPAKTQTPTPVTAPEKVEPVPAIDCAMVKKPDPQFHSNMPVIRPHPGANHTLRVVPVAPCK